MHSPHLYTQRVRQSTFIYKLWNNVKQCVHRSGSDDGSGGFGAESGSGFPDSEDSLSGSSSEDDGVVERGRVDITSQRLQSMHAVATYDKSAQLSTYATNGRSKQRCREALQQPICKCRCFIPLQVLLRVAIAFWMLNKQGQDSILWSIQCENAGGSDKKDWFIEGLTMKMEHFFYKVNMLICLSLVPNTKLFTYPFRTSSV